MQSQGLGNTLPVSLVRKNFFLSKAGKFADNQDVGGGSDYRRLQNKKRCFKDLTHLGMCLEIAFRVGIFVTTRRVMGFS